MTLLPSTQVGNTFVYQGRKYRSLSAVEAAEKDFIAKAEKAAGRPLSLRELLHGVEHPEDRTPQQIVSDHSFHVEIVKDVHKADVHPFDSADSQIADRRESRRALDLKMREAYDARVRGALPDPDGERREEAVAHSHELLASVLYSSHVPMSIVTRARQLETIARRSSLDEYKTASAELIQRIAAHKTERVVAADLKRAAQLADLPQQFEAVQPLAEQPKKVAPYTWQDLKAEPDAAKRHKMWVQMEEAKNAAASE